MKAEVGPNAVYSDFKAAFPEMASPANTLGAGQSSIKRDRAVREAYRRLNRQGWDVVTVVNLHSFPLDFPMGPLGHLTVPKKNTGEPYALKIINQPRISIKDLGDGNIEVVPVFPKELAEDLALHYVESGGVFYYMGTGPVPADAMDKAMEKMLSWYWILFNEGNANWAQYNKNPKHISDRMRDAAKELWRLKLIGAQPEWITVSRNESPDQPCEGCGTIIPKIARFCPHCNTIYDPTWVKARRPDLWAAQNPPGMEVSQSAAEGDANSTDVVDIEKMIEEEKALLEGNEPAPEAPKTPAKVKKNAR